VASPARRLAHRVLLDMERTRETLGDRLARADVEALPARERGLLHELVLGTLRRRGGVDHALAPLCNRPLADLDPEARAALRLGAYQLLHLRVPAHAAVSESVDLARSAARGAAGLVNAVLRRLAREGAPPVADRAADPLGWLASEGSLPRWLAERWLTRLGREAAVRRAEALLSPPATAFRLNPRVADALARVEAAGVAPRPLPVPGAWEATAETLTPLARDGVVYVQDLGSQLVCHAAAARGLILDACAAPGGKSTLLADLSPDGVVVAAEASPRRLRSLARLARRWGSPNLRLVGADARRPPFRGGLDAVLLDAPCSGLGTLARRPDLRWRSSLTELGRQSERQRELLKRLAEVVRPGGRLVYSVCSLEPEECEEVVVPFLESHPGFDPLPPPPGLASFADGSFLRTLPERDRSDGFFIAALRRR
jgi:16S rRNA (cytosine967-C5)-methyltransferase